MRIVPLVQYNHSLVGELEQISDEPITVVLCSDPLAAILAEHHAARRQQKPRVQSPAVEFVKPLRREIPAHEQIITYKAQMYLPYKAA